MFRMEEAQLELKLAKGVKSNKENFCRYVSTKQKFKPNVGPLAA